ncbi:hypothetical protein [Miniphocaeibacter halophilus]|uniref:Uncharacterized protein n=1 Tax=Miniphocaeibacter halophilus TaxID=2931922 RepID=A0AC61N767_9FIRM|nr:hypothetical protein [Miniphocaeibacter halophilus]QQK08213.1 hypothetical protein JFY71_01360 [Miniphocaeibacter halophilus]
MVNASNEILTAKLLEIDKKYTRLISRIYEIQFCNEDTILEELDEIKKIYNQLKEELINSSENSKSEYIRELAKAQLDFNKRVEKIQKNIDDIYLDNNEQIDERIVESIIVYAEFTLDMALYSMVNVLYNSLIASNCQLNYNRKSEKGE